MHKYTCIYDCTAWWYLKINYIKKCSDRLILNKSENMNDALMVLFIANITTWYIKVELEINLYNLET